MSKVLFRILGLGFIALAAISPSAAQTVDEILGKMVQAQGGTEALLAVKDYAMYGDVQLHQQGMSASFSLYWKAPDKYRQEMQMDAMFIASFFNGDSGWGVHPRAPKGEKLSGAVLKSLKRSALAPSAICDPAKHGLTFELKGRENVSGKDCFVLEMTFPDGFKEQQLVDSQSYFVIKRRFKTAGDSGPVVDAEVLYLGYKKFGGVMFPSVFANVAEGREYNRIRIADIKVNGGLADSLFEPEK